MAVFSLYGLELEVDDACLSERIARALSKGWYEREEVDIINFALRPGDRVVELGAGLGVTTMVAARIVGGEAVRAYEANPALIEQLNANLARNGLNVEVASAILLPRAKARAQKSARLHLGNEFWGSSVIPDGAGNDVGQADVVTLGLEDVLSAHRANVLIMDIEGLEVSIMELADLGRIDKLIVEIHYDRAGAAPTNKAIFGLVDKGFAIDFQRSSRGVLLLTRPSPDGQAQIQ